MAFCELKYFSKALGMATAADILLPETDHPGPFFTFYLLHGLSDDHTIWQRRTSIERYVQEFPMIVVMPNGGRGFYCDAQEGMKWETAIVSDLLGYVDKMFPTIPHREGRCIGGLSMGGYGAVKLALKFPDLFCSAVSHSGALGFAHFTPVPKSARDDAFNLEFIRVVGENPMGGPEDCFTLAERLPEAQRPALRIDCGTEDFLLDSNRAFHAHLEHLGYSHEYAEFPGEHNWAYWDIHVQEAIAFHLKNLNHGLNG